LPEVVPLLLLPPPHPAARVRSRMAAAKRAKNFCFMIFLLVFVFAGLWFPIENEEEKVCLPSFDLSPAGGGDHTESAG
jgi:hypothetical protein